MFVFPLKYEMLCQLVYSALFCYHILISCFVAAALLWKRCPGWLSELRQGEVFSRQHPDSAPGGHVSQQVPYFWVHWVFFLMNIILDLRACHSLWVLFIWDKVLAFWAIEEKKNRLLCVGQLSNIFWESNWRSFYRDTELRLQTDFKSGRKFVRVCLQEGKSWSVPRIFWDKTWKESNAASTWCSSGRCLPEPSPTEDSSLWVCRPAGCISLLCSQPLLQWWTCQYQTWWKSEPDLHLLQ